MDYLAESVIDIKLRHFECQLKLLQEHFAYYATVTGDRERQHQLAFAAEKLEEIIRTVYSGTSET